MLQWRQAPLSVHTSMNRRVDTLARLEYKYSRRLEWAQCQCSIGHMNSIRGQAALPRSLLRQHACALPGKALGRVVRYAAQGGRLSMIVLLGTGGAVLYFSRTTARQLVTALTPSRRGGSASEGGQPCCAPLCGCLPSLESSSSSSSQQQQQQQQRVARRWPRGPPAP